MQHKVYKFSLRVPYAHIDKMGFVYYANYLVYFEMARADLLREAGMPYTEIEKHGIMLPVVEAHCVYRKPANYDDLLVVLSKCVAIEGPRLRIEYEIRRETPAPELIATGYTEHVCCSMEGKVLKPIPEVRKLVEMGE